MAAFSKNTAGHLISMEMGAVLRLALICSVFAATYVDAEFGPMRKLAGERPLPPGVCYWRQGNLINHIPTGPSKSDCKLVVRDPEFLEILGQTPKIKVLVETNAHEGAVWYPDKNEFYFSSGRITGANGQTITELKKVNLGTGAVTMLNPPASNVPNGMVLDNEGNLLVCQQGLKKQGGFIQRINLKTMKATVVADNWFGVPFNSPNDAVVKRDGSIWFTDPSYGSVQGFRSAPKVKNQVYKISASGVVDAVADGFTQPNGLAFSHDEKRLYVTDTGFALGVQGQFDVARPHSVTVFDVDKNGLLSNRRLFASVGVYDGSGPGLGIPDGIKVDTNERVYVGTADGVQVFSHSGKPLGLIHLAGGIPNMGFAGKPLGLIHLAGGIPNMGFAGRNLDTLYMLNDTTISYVKLKVKAAGLKYVTTN